VDERSERVERAFEIPVLIGAALVIPVIVVEQSDASEAWQSAASVTNWVIWSIFAAEVVVMLAIVPERRSWLHAHLLEVAVVVLTPPFLPSSLQALRAIRLLRLVRLLLLVKYARRVFSLEGVRFAGLVAVVTALAGGAAFASAEPGHSTWDGVWWAVATMTTVGYGDLSPETTAGRLVGIAVMLVGVGFIALVTGAVAERFLAGTVEHVEEDVEELESADREVLAELRDVAEQLRRLETRVQALTRPPR